MLLWGGLPVFFSELFILLSREANIFFLKNKSFCYSNKHSNPRWEKGGEWVRWGRQGPANSSYK